MATTFVALDAITADKVIDARGAACPGPLLEVKKGMGTVPVGSVVELWSTDPVTKTDINAWSTKAPANWRRCGGATRSRSRERPAPRKNSWRRFDGIPTSFRLFLSADFFRPTARRLR